MLNVSSVNLDIKVKNVKFEINNAMINVNQSDVKVV